MKHPISISIIASNEAHNLPRCLDSVASWSSEIVVVVNDCTDGTEEIAKQYGAKVYTNPWVCHRDQKNVALEKCTQDWVLAIDADEAVSPELRDAILKFYQHEANKFNGAYFPRLNKFLGKWVRHGDWAPDYNLRFFKRGKAKWGGSPEHDKIVLEGQEKKLDAYLFHYSNLSISHQINKINFFSDFFLQRKIDAGKKWSCLESIIRPFWRFIRAYFLRLGFLDGYRGFYIAIITSFSTFVRYSRLYEHEVNHEDKSNR